MLNSLMMTYSGNQIRFEDNSACQIIKLFQNSIYIFLDANLLNLMTYV